MLKTADRPKMTAPKEADGEKKGRKASKETRRLQLIEATIDSLAKRGYAETTMADVADGAGLSRGIVNFHFESKEKLLVATLQHMSEEYAAHWRGALERAGPDPARRMAAVVAADFDRAVCTRRKLAAWCAFWGEAQSRPMYQTHCSSNDRAYTSTLEGLCQRMNDEHGYGWNPVRAARVIRVTTEGVWFDLMTMSEPYGLDEAMATVWAAAAAFFPRHFGPEGLLGR